MNSKLKTILQVLELCHSKFPTEGDLYLIIAAMTQLQSHQDLENSDFCIKKFIDSCWIDFESNNCSKLRILISNEWRRIDIAEYPSDCVSNPSELGERQELTEIVDIIISQTLTDAMRYFEDFSMKTLAKILEAPSEVVLEKLMESERGQYGELEPLAIQKCLRNSKYLQIKEKWTKFIEELSHLNRSNLTKELVVNYFE
jgi:hypothetical protein